MCFSFYTTTETLLCELFENAFILTTVLGSVVILTTFMTPSSINVRKQFTR